MRIMVANKWNFDAVGDRFILPRVIDLVAVDDRARIPHVPLTWKGPASSGLGRGRPRISQETGRRQQLLKLLQPKALPVSTRLQQTALFAQHACHSWKGPTRHETQLHVAGYSPSEVVGVTLPAGEKRRREKCDAVALALKQAPSFHARSWGWPAPVGCGKDDAGEDSRVWG